MEIAKQSLDSDLKTLTTQAENDLVHLTSMYETMKPKQAAKIIDKMNPSLAAGCLREMKSQHAGLILAGIDAKKLIKSA